MFLEWFFILILLVLYLYQSVRTRQLSDDFEKTKINIERDKIKEEAMLASIGDGVVATDKDGVIIFINQAARSLLSWDNKMLGKNLSEVSLLSDSKGQHVTVGKHPLHLALTKRKKIITDEYHFVKKDKTDLSVYISAMPIILKNEVIGAIEVFRDVTKEKEVDRIKSEFVFLASHQLRTPLSTINWYVEMLMSGDAGPINEEQKNYLKEVYDGNQRMVEMVNDLLNVSRLDLGTLAVQLVPADISSLTTEIIKENNLDITEKNLKIDLQFHPDVVGVQTDIKMMRILLQNLITNAIKYTPANGAITISLETNKAKNYLLTVADTGFGIPLAAQSKIFTKLFRADNVMAKEITGTGLGLYMVKSIVEKLQGKIWFESQEDKGTKFFVSFPVQPVLKKNIMEI